MFSLLAGGCFPLILLAGAQPGERLEELQSRALEAFAGADDGELSRIDDELARLARTLSGEDAALAGACRGVALTARAETAGMMQRRRLFRQAVRLLDGAVEEAPEDPRVRLLRARHSAAMPRLFGREEIADQDYRQLLELMEGAGEYREFPDRLQAEVLVSYASWLLRNDEPEEALAMLDRAAGLDAGGEVGQRLLQLRELAGNRLPADNADPDEGK